jgi:hypothetical protein
MQLIDKRNTQAPVPQNFSDYLTVEQEVMLLTLSKFGWQVKFIRRQIYQEPTVVLGRSDNTFGILEKDGRIHDICIRKMRAEQIFAHGQETLN